MAASARWTDPALVAQWLYHFGTLPRLPAMDRDFGPDDDPIAVLGMTVGSATRRLLEAQYEATSLAGWYSFARAPVRAQTVPVSKLYVSPRPEALADAFPRIAQVLARFEVRSFKIGRGIEGLLRPDKIVVYFEDGAHMEQVTAALCRALRGCPAQGAPFTSELGGNGLVSSGVDPPASDPAVSWRSWVTKRLAASLTTHRCMQRDDVVAAALAEIRLAGIDPDLWRPTGDAFRDARPL
jgi:hypothetical protein